MASQALHLEIVSPEGITYEGTIDELIINTIQGEIAILPNHANIFTKLVEGEAIVRTNNKDMSIIITGGFLEIQDNTISVICDFASRSENIEIARIQEAKKRAEEVLAGKVSTEDFTMAEKELQRSILTLKVAEKIRRRERRS